MNLNSPGYTLYTGVPVHLRRIALNALKLRDRIPANDVCGESMFQLVYRKQLVDQKGKPFFLFLDEIQCGTVVPTSQVVPLAQTQEAK